MEPPHLHNPEKARYSTAVPAVEQASRVLICLGKAPKAQMTLTEICAQVGIHKSKGYSILNTLMRFGLIDKDPQSKAYALGPGLLFLARKALSNLDFIHLVKPVLEEIANATGSTALFGLLYQEQVFIVAKHEGNQDIGVTIGLGHRFHFTAGAHGKAIVAFLPEGDQTRVLSRERLYFYGKSGAVDKDRLRAELLQCRKEGFARDPGRLHPGVSALAAPVFGPFGKILGCMILIGTFPEFKMGAYGPRLARAARDVSKRLAGDRPLPFAGKMHSSAVP